MNEGRVGGAESRKEMGTTVQGLVGQEEDLVFDPKGGGALLGCGQRRLLAGALSWLLRG